MGDDVLAHTYVLMQYRSSGLLCGRLNKRRSFDLNAVNQPAISVGHVGRQGQQIKLIVAKCTKKANVFLSRLCNTAVWGILCIPRGNKLTCDCKMIFLKRNMSCHSRMFILCCVSWARKVLSFLLKTSQPMLECFFSCSLTHNFVFFRMLKTFNTILSEFHRSECLHRFSWLRKISDYNSNFYLLLSSHSGHKSTL